MDTILPDLSEENCQIFDINRRRNKMICTPTYLQDKRRIRIFHVCIYIVYVHSQKPGSEKLFAIMKDLGNEGHNKRVFTVAGWVGASGGNLPLRRLDRDGDTERGRDGVEVRGQHQAGRRADRGQQHGPAQVGNMLFRL